MITTLQVEIDDFTWFYNILVCFYFYIQRILITLNYHPNVPRGCACARKTIMGSLGPSGFFSSKKNPRMRPGGKPGWRWRSVREFWGESSVRNVHKVVSWVIGLPPVIIHILGSDFPWNKPSSELGVARWLETSVHISLSLWWMVLDGGWLDLDGPWNCWIHNWFPSFFFGNSLRLLTFRSEKPCSFQQGREWAWKSMNMS